MLRRIGLLAAAIACAAPAASAQEIVFSRIPWNTPADSVRARLEALGYTYAGAVGNGDRAFRRADGGSVHVMLRAGRMVGIYVREAAAGAAVDARYRALADSLQAAFGTPLDLRPESRRWEAGLASVGVRIVGSPETGQRGVGTDWTGPGWYDEM